MSTIDIIIYSAIAPTLATVVLFFFWLSALREFRWARIDHALSKKKNAELYESLEHIRRMANDSRDAISEADLDRARIAIQAIRRESYEATGVTMIEPAPSAESEEK